MKKWQPAQWTSRGADILKWWQLYSGGCLVRCNILKKALYPSLPQFIFKILSVDLGLNEFPRSRSAWTLKELKSRAIVWCLGPFLDCIRHMMHYFFHHSSHHSVITVDLCTYLYLGEWSRASSFFKTLSGKEKENKIKCRMSIMGQEEHETISKEFEMLRVGGNVKIEQNIFSVGRSGWSAPFRIRPYHFSFII